jgi:dihydrolipoamide dehydrogenase
MSETIDVAIIGAGSTGLAALREVRKRTQNFVIINDGPWGTTCARVGCMPSKLLIEAANAFHHRHTFDEFGIHGADHLAVDGAAVLRRVRRLRDEFVAGTLEATQSLGERAISGRAQLLGEGRLRVNGRELRARSIIIATGSHPVLPEPWRALGTRVHTTDTVFEQENLPARMAVVGTGPLGIELAQAYARLGVAVTAFGRSHTVAGVSDAAVNAVALDLLGKEFTLHLGGEAQLSATATGLRVSDGTHEVEVDQVLAALGRRPNIDGLGLETLGVALDEHGLPVVDRSTLQVGGLRVFLAGDANAAAPLLHEAADDGYIAGINATQPEAAGVTCFVRRTPLAIVFSEPGIAVAGRSFDTLDSARIVIGEVDFSHQGRARAGQRNHGLLRIYADAQNGRLLGSEMCSPAAEHMAHLLALAIDRSLTVHDLLGMPFYHPVLEEGLRTALRNAAKHLSNHLPDGYAGHAADLARCDGSGTSGLD